MGTRSAICEPYGDNYRGRYVHWDGYPTYMGKALWGLVKRDGVDKVRRTVIHDHYGWSQINPEQQVRASQFEDDGRFAQVNGYGIAYTDTVISHRSLGRNYQQVTKDEWVTPAENYNTEWHYVLTDSRLWILDTYGSHSSQHDWDDDEPNWEDIEGSEE